MHFDRSMSRARSANHARGTTSAPITIWTGWRPAQKRAYNQSWYSALFPLALFLSLWLVLPVPGFVLRQITNDLFHVVQPSQRTISDFQKQVPTVVMTCNLRRVVGALAVINSTLSNLRQGTAVNFRVIVPPDEAVPFAALIHDTLEQHQYESVSVVPYTERTVNVVVRDQFRSLDLRPQVVYARYFLARLLPDLERVIYLDVDTVVLGDLTELWHEDLHGFPIGAVERCGTRMQKNFVFDSNAGRQHLLGRYNRSECVFNTGVLVFNLGMWRTSPLFESQLVYWTEMNAREPLYTLGSQPPFNLVFYHNYYKLSPRWNTMDAGQPMHHAKGLHETQRAKVLHWNGVWKPWEISPRPLNSEHFTKYLPHWDRIGPAAEKLTVIIMTMGTRMSLLRAVLGHLTKWGTVERIVVVWNNPKTECPVDMVPQRMAHRKLFTRCVEARENDMQNRLLAHHEVETEAVLHHDDDAMLSLHSLELGFRVWQRHRQQIVGFEPRVHEYEPATKGWRYEFELSREYSLVIGKFFFVSRIHMEMYSANTNLISASKGRACEDIIFNLFVAQQTALGPIAVEGDHWELGGRAELGLSSKLDTMEWTAQRQKCIQLGETVFGALFLSSSPKSTQIATAYNPEYNTIIFRDVYPGESICADTVGVKDCAQRRRRKAHS